MGSESKDGYRGVHTSYCTPGRQRSSRALFDFYERLPGSEQGIAWKILWDLNMKLRNDFFVLVVVCIHCFWGACNRLR